MASKTWTAGDVAIKKRRLFKKSIQGEITRKRMPEKNPLFSGPVFVSDMDKKLIFKELKKLFSSALLCVLRI